jgi:hypothetical protein
MDDEGVQGTTGQSGELVATAPIEAVADVPDAFSPEEFRNALRGIATGVAEIRGQLEVLGGRVAEIEAGLGSAAKQVSFLPPQVRMLVGKVDGLATAISEPQYRALLLSLLGISDLVDQILRTPASDAVDSDASHRRNYEVLRTQLRQILHLNGLSLISAEGTFNAELHRAVERVVVTDPADANRVLEVVRPGFRTENAVLRFAEVRVGYYTPPPEDGA